MSKDAGPIHGAEELSAKLKELGAKVETRIMRRAVVAGAKVFRDAARKNAQGLKLPAEAKGRLRRAIRHRRTRGKPGTVEAGLFIASIPKKDGDRSVDDPHAWGKWFEKGTKDRKRGPKGNAKLSRRKRKAGRLIHSGKITAQPFLEPAFDHAYGDALEAVTTIAREGIEKEATK